MQQSEIESLADASAAAHELLHAAEIPVPG